MCSSPFSRGRGRVKRPANLSGSHGISRLQLGLKTQTPNSAREARSSGCAEHCALERFGDTRMHKRDLRKLLAREVCLHH
jgi:hypothetical protein